jgi:TonB family protein
MTGEDSVHDRNRMKTKTLGGVVLLFFTAIIVARAEQPRDQFASAVDAQGIRHVARSPGFGPSFADVVFGPKPEYPYSERRRYNEGVAVVRMDIDLKTGMVTNATIIRSSGFPKLDDAAFNALWRWRFKPGKWKEAEVPVVFKVSRR